MTYRSTTGMWTRPALFALALCAGLCATAEAATWQVDSTLDAVDATPGDGLCATADGACSLRAAIQEANADAGVDEIVLPPGTFMLTLAGASEDLGATGDLDVRSALTLRGAGPELTMIDGAALDRVLDLLAPSGATSVAIEGLALANGRLNMALTTSAGIGLRVATSVTLQLTAVDVRDNVATTAFGGAIGIDNRGCLSGSRVRILRNRDPAIIGGGHALAGGVVSRGATSCFTLIDSEISDNIADQAGAIYADSSAPITLRRSLIADNVARFAGAMLLNQNNEVLFEDVTISGNRGNPGAVLNDGGARLTLRNCTVTGNRASNNGSTVGGLEDVHGGFGRMFLSNTIVAGNGPGSSANDCNNLVSVDGGNIIGSIAGCHASLMASDRTNVNPQLGALADNGGPTRSHLPGPPALDTGVAAACTSSDQRGIPRPQDGDDDGVAQCDVGAIEVAAVLPLFADGFE